MKTINFRLSSDSLKTEKNQERKKREIQVPRISQEREEKEKAKNQRTV